jgi:hypothetical protein
MDKKPVYIYKLRNGIYELRDERGNVLEWAFDFNWIKDTANQHGYTLNGFFHESGADKYGCG